MSNLKKIKEELDTIQKNKIKTNIITLLCLVLLTGMFFFGSIIIILYLAKYILNI